ncbi:tetratricopeptide repeat protein [Aquimarina sp. ERC-38]|uniref:tetratricopeptide repeat protein n=1 Tax=Aquimarina sp. ERC-38 TaxID=2949996 RepID=UPI0022484840|nr:tetratricopeptide repeat protein [Aquimarina sp. ERC-38]UZO80894.1 tetratricopeptide repeat protein [Aquimarina sp. ERC-38]
MIRTSIISFLFFFFFILSNAQQSAVYTNKLVHFNQALDLYNNKQFLAAQNLFDDVKDNVEDENIEAECTYYIANCAVWLNQKGADELMENFVQEYPTSIKRNAAYLDVANYYFDNGKYAFARKWYERVDTSTMSRKQKETFNFNNGYAYFKIQRFNEAQKFLTQVEESEEYGAKAKYYLGFIAYEGDNYQEADKLFDEVKDLDTYNKNLSYFQSDMNFKSGDFEGAIKEGLTQLPNAKPQEKSELNKIIGESYFNLGQYDKAIPYLKAYKGRKGKWNNTDYYLLGYAFYKQGQYEEAISEFNKIVGGDNATAQNAYYHLAESYLETNKKQEALNAFKNASEMTFDAKIKEDATYNYAKLSYEIGNPYESIPVIISNYLKTYPDTERKDELNELLINSYITTKNYKAAMDLLENSKNQDDQSIYQKVAFLRGIELYNNTDYQEAIVYFDKSLTQPVVPEFQAKSQYWKGESYYLLGDYKRALENLVQFTELPVSGKVRESEAIAYHLGYTLFKLKDYAKAIQQFEYYQKKMDEEDEKALDTYLRLGDCYFISSDYWPAMKFYNAAIQKGGANVDYAYYQKAISYGFVGKNDQKISDLDVFIKKYPGSNYKDDALFALGDTYISEDKVQDGIATYDRIIKETPKSSYVPKAMLKQGLVYYNKDQGDRALTKFKKVVAEFPGTEEAIQAVNTARLIYVDTGRTDEYASWVKGLSFVDVTDADLDNTTFEAAEKQYVENNSNAAITGFQKYLADFPNGLHALASNFYLAQLYFQQDEKQDAIRHYQFVLDKERTNYTEQAAARLAQIYLENKDYESSIPVLQRLEETADFPQNIVFAQSNLMKALYQRLDYDQTVAYAEKVLANTNIENDIKSDAQIFIARAAFQTGDKVKSKTAYTKVEKIAKGALAAEALYYKAYFLNEAGEFKTSNETVQLLAKDYAAYREFGAKGLILMAQNFYSLGDAYQATYILDSVIKNFSDFPQVVDNAQFQLTAIKAEEAKTNSSIQTKG